MGSANSTEKSRLEQQLSKNLPAACLEAARTISESHVLLLCTGAGFSADSGLATYADVAKVPVYQSRGLEYKDLSTPYCLNDDPELFWGFWGQCYNDYRDTPPHKGYSIVDRWAERWFRHSATATQLRSLLASGDTRPSTGNPNDPYAVSDYPGAFFAFTSNVDAHHYDWFQACEIRECHGNVELYQCATGRRACRFSSSMPLCAEGQEDRLGMCADAVWRAPLDYRFYVDYQTMLAPAARIPTQANENQQERNAKSELHRASNAGKQSSCQDTCFKLGRKANMVEPVCVGEVRGGGRPFALRSMPESLAGDNVCRGGFVGNHPTCPSCGGPARPAVCMFGDNGWNDVRTQQRRWERWVANVGQIAESMASKSSALRVTILEIGCGSNVPTVRKTAEQQFRMLSSKKANVRLIRVNPDVYGALAELPEYESMIPVLSIKACGLESLQYIDAAMPVSHDPQ